MQSEREILEDWIANRYRFAQDLESKNSEANAIAERRESLRSRGGARGSYTPEKRRETQSEVSYGTQTERESEGQ